MTIRGPTDSTVWPSQRCLSTHAKADPYKPNPEPPSFQRARNIAPRCAHCNMPNLIPESFEREYSVKFEMQVGDSVDFPASVHLHQGGNRNGISRYSG